MNWFKQTIDKDTGLRKMFNPPPAGTYAVDLRCANCKYEYTENITNGVQVSFYLKEVPCPNCHCSNVLQQV